MLVAVLFSIDIERTTGIAFWKDAYVKLAAISAFTSTISSSGSTIPSPTPKLIQSIHKI
jgi:hypothetical protein